MICEKCGQWIEDGSKACGSCGTPVNVQGVQNEQGTDAAAQGAANGAPAAVQPGMAAGVDAGGMGAGGYAVNPGQGGQPPLTKDQFYKHPNVAYARTQIRAAAIISYVVAGISLVFGGMGVIIDVLLIIGLGLGIQLLRSRVCAVILTVYGVWNTIWVTLSTGTLGGWWILLAGIYAIIYTFKYQGAWTEYQRTGVIKDLSPAGKKK